MCDSDLDLMRSDAVSNDIFEMLKERTICPSTTDFSLSQQRMPSKSCLSCSKQFRILLECESEFCNALYHANCLDAEVCILLSQVPGLKDTDVSCPRCTLTSLTLSRRVAGTKRPYVETDTQAVVSLTTKRNTGKRDIDKIVQILNGEENEIMSIPEQVSFLANSAVSKVEQ